MEDDEAREQLAAMRAALDQAREGTKEIAALMVAYLRALTDEGATPEQALALTLGYQAAFFASAFGSGSM